MSDENQTDDTDLGNGDAKQFVDGATTDEKPAVNVDVTLTEKPLAEPASPALNYERTIIDLVQRVAKLEADYKALVSILARRHGTKC